LVIIDIVAGAFGYIGCYITHQLLQRGERVRTITTHPDNPNPFGEQVQAFPYDFNHPDRLRQHLAGAQTSFNTYSVRFPLATFS
jgi:NADH dehydrogenase